MAAGFWQSLIKKRNLDNRDLCVFSLLCYPNKQQHICYFYVESEGDGEADGGCDRVKKKEKTILKGKCWHPFIK